VSLHNIGVAPEGYAIMILTVFTNWLWIPFIIWADIAVRCVGRKEAA
jgi:ACR3 family arsenite efflux pump ArsB